MPLSMPIDDDLREYFMHCLECADKEDCRDKYQTAFFSINELDEVGQTRLRIIYDLEAQHHRLQLINNFANDKATKVVLSKETDPQQLESINQWLAEVMYGRSRLWYLIRDYNENYDEEFAPHLNPFTTFNQLITD